MTILFSSSGHSPSADPLEQQSRVSVVEDQFTRQSGVSRCLTQSTDGQKWPRRLLVLSTRMLLSTKPANIDHG